MASEASAAAAEAPFGYLTAVPHPAAAAVPAAKQLPLPSPATRAVDRNPFHVGRLATNAWALANPCISGVHVSLTRQLLYSPQSQQHKLAESQHGAAPAATAASAAVPKNNTAEPAPATTAVVATIVRPASAD